VLLYEFKAENPIKTKFFATRPWKGPSDSCTTAFFDSEHLLFVAVAIVVASFAFVVAGCLLWLLMLFC
jgi:hypothetical protein